MLDHGAESLLLTWSRHSDLASQSEPPADPPVRLEGSSRSKTSEPVQFFYVLWLELSCGQRACQLAAAPWAGRGCSPQMEERPGLANEGPMSLNYIEQLLRLTASVLGPPLAGWEPADRHRV